MWQKIKLGDVAKLKNGFAFKSKDYSDEGVPVIRISDINDNLVTTKGAKRVPMKEEYNDYQIEEDSILIAMSGATTGKFGIFQSNEKALQNQRVGKFEYDENKISNQFLYYLLYDLKRKILKEAYGGAQPNISSKKIEAMEVKIPPLPIQNRIVEKIEELFSDLDHGVENLKKAQQQLKIYRQAVLKDAFEGKFTREWREQQEDLPTPEELLEQIKAERKAHRQRELAEWEKEVEQWEKDGKPGRKPRKPRKPVDYEEITYEESIHFESIADCWAIVRLGQISDSKGGHAFKSKKFKDSGKYQVLRIGNIRPNKIRYDESPVYLNEVDDKTLNKALLQKGDVVITLTGTRKKRDYGYAAIITDNNLLLNQRIAYLRFYRTIDPKFFLYFAQTRVFQNQFFSNETGNVGQGNVSMSAVTESVLPAPSLSEQKQVIEEIESRFSIIDQLEQTIKENLQKAEALRQSILKKAFSGELVEE